MGAAAGNDFADGVIAIVVLPPRQHAVLRRDPAMSLERAAMQRRHGRSIFLWSHSLSIGTVIGRRDAND
jgi:hypothetical protein